MGMILCIAPSHIVGYGDIVDRSGGFKFKLSAFYVNIQMF